MAEYWLRNTTKNDVSLGDLGYKIPARQGRNLLSPTARLKVKNIIKSRREGSIARRLRSGVLVEVKHDIVLDPPPKTMANSKVTVIQPRRVKTVTSMDKSKLGDKLDDIVLREEDELLKELEDEDRLMGELGDAPVVAKKGKKKDDSAS